MLDKYCVGCHDGRAAPPTATAIADLRSERFAASYQGLPLSKLGASRLDPELRRRLGTSSHPAIPRPSCIGDRKTLYTPAYEALIPFIRRVNVEDYVGCTCRASTTPTRANWSRCSQKGHHGVKLDAEAWDRLVTWIDLNGPCHGTWGDVAPDPDGADRRRRELAQLYGGPKEDPEAVPEGATPVCPTSEPRPEVLPGEPATPSHVRGPFRTGRSEDGGCHVQDRSKQQRTAPVPEKERSTWATA